MATLDARNAFTARDTAKSRALFGNLVGYFALSAQDWIDDMRRRAGMAYETGRFSGEIADTATE